MSSSEIDLERQLDISRIACAVELPERPQRRECQTGARIRESDVRLRVVGPNRELSVVEDVEELEAELGSDALADLRILEQRKIPLIDARRAQEIAAGISERSIDRPCERERVDILNRRIKIPHTGARQPAC